MLIKYYQTIIRLKSIQIHYQIWYRIRSFLRKLTGFKYSLSIWEKGYPLVFSQWIVKNNTFDNYTFTFLNQTLTFSVFPDRVDHNGPTIFWSEMSYGKLWAYNLNYMDYLLQTEIDRETRFSLIEQFINDLPKNNIGLEPYPISLRAINWVKLLSIKDEKKSQKETNQIQLINKIDASLYAQFQILINNLEFHILGNHLLENAFSLLFGAFYFRDKDLWLKATKLLEGELDEQILSDGGHFELSPMYHQIVLDRLLDCINLVQNNDLFGNQESLLILLKEKAKKMLLWLNNMTFSGGEIPLLNDSAFGIAPSTYQLIEYALHLGILNINYSRSNVLSDSGYRKFYNENYECIFDIGEIGPVYQPGHAHADTFTFELYIKGNPVIVDTGTSTYNHGRRRLLERGSLSHNTVTICGEDSSDVWSSHRVSRRASIDLHTDEDGKVSVSHNGYRRFNISINRTIESNVNYILITDIVSTFCGEKGKSDSASSKIGISHMHFHPSRQIKLKNQILFIDSLAEIRFEGLLDIKMVEYYYAPGFNILIKSQGCEISFDKKLITKICILNSLKMTENRHIVNYQKHL